MDIFPKWLVYGFGRKFDIFPTVSFLANMGQGNVFSYTLERKNNFPGYKKRKLKMSKNGHFSKVFSPWFWSKIGHFSNFFL